MSDMPAKIWALSESELTGPYTTSPIWSDLPLNTSFVPYIRADLVREAMEALRRLTEQRKGVEADILSAHSNRGNGPSEWMREDDRGFRGDLRRAFDAATVALSKLKEAGL